MPDYYFICPKCETGVKITQAMTDKHETDCPGCGEHLDANNGRVFDAAPDIWKCGGCHRKDYAGRK